MKYWLDKITGRAARRWNASFNNQSRVPPWRGRTKLDVHERSMDNHWIHHKGDVLDVGCGDGSLTGRLAQRTDCRVHGIDISEVAIFQAKSRLKDLPFEIQERLSFEVVDILKSKKFSKAAQGRFDLVTDVGCFHNFNRTADQRYVVQTIHEVLKPGGKWLLSIRAFRGEGSGTPEAEKLALTSQIVQQTEGYFSLERVESCDLRGPNAKSEMPGLSFFLLKV